MILLGAVGGGFRGPVKQEGFAAMSFSASSHMCCHSSAGSGRVFSDRPLGVGPPGLFAVTPDPLSSDKSLSSTLWYPANFIGLAVIPEDDAMSSDRGTSAWISVKHCAVASLTIRPRCI